MNEQEKIINEIHLLCKEAEQLPLLGIVALKQY